MSKEIPLTAGRLAVIDDADFELINAFKWRFNRIRSDPEKGYAVRLEGPRGSAKMVSMHEFIAGKIDGKEVDHIDGDRLNNRRGNLRHCTHAQNSANQKPTKGRMFKGVTLNRSGSQKPWAARLVCDGKSVWLGRHKTELEAARAYDIGAKKHFGPYARLNFPEKTNV